VVYNRPPHYFTWRDAVRVLSAAATPVVEASNDDLWRAWVIVSLSLREAVKAIRTREEMSTILEEKAAWWGETGLDFGSFLETWLRAHAGAE
jgi:hypothetical protein